MRILVQLTMVFLLAAGCTTPSPSTSPVAGEEGVIASSGTWDLTPSAFVGGKLVADQARILVEKRPENTSWIEVIVRLSPGAPVDEIGLALSDGRDTINTTVLPMNVDHGYIVAENGTYTRGPLWLRVRPNTDTGSPTVSTATKLDFDVVVHTRAGFDAELEAIRERANATS